MIDISEIYVLQNARDAVIHGVDVFGIIQPAGSSPTYGGYQTGEDFSVYYGSSTSPIGVYVPQLNDRDDMSDPLLPYVEITYDPHVASTTLLSREVLAGTIVWRVYVTDNRGYVVEGATTYKNDRAAMILRNRLFRMAETLPFNSVEVLEHGDAEPTQVYVHPDDDNIFIAEVSMYLEYIDEI